MFDEPIEVASCTGNIAQINDWTDEDTPHAHTHAVLARDNGDVVAGHLNAGTVFVGEIYMRTFETSLTREYDETPTLRTDESWCEQRNDGDRRTGPVTGLEPWD